MIRIIEVSQPDFESDHKDLEVAQTDSESDLEVAQPDSESDLEVAQPDSESDLEVEEQELQPLIDNDVTAGSGISQENSKIRAGNSLDDQCKTTKSKIKIKWLFATGAQIQYAGTGSDDGPDHLLNLKIGRRLTCTKCRPCNLQSLSRTTRTTIGNRLQPTIFVKNYKNYDRLGCNLQSLTRTTITTIG